MSQTIDTLVRGLESRGVDIAMLEEVKRLHNLAYTDGLTGISNRRCYEESQSTGYVIAFDMNGFKQVNDTQGHSAGDKVLIDVADVVRQNTRSTDMKGYRMGGDEYVITLDNMPSIDSVRVVAERLGSQITQKTGLTASIGIGATYQEADKNSYIAKREYKTTGRYTVVGGVQ